MDLWGEIGTAAGRIYSAIEGGSKPAAVADVKKKTKLDATMFAMGLGWLAREDKVVVEKKGQKITVKAK